MVAAVEEGRNFIGIEKNEDVALFKKEKIDYIQIAKERIFSSLYKLDFLKRQSLYRVNLVGEFYGVPGDSYGKSYSQ